MEIALWYFYRGLGAISLERRKCKISARVRDHKRVGIVVLSRDGWYFAADSARLYSRVFPVIRFIFFLQRKKKEFQKNKSRDKIFLNRVVIIKINA